jgi:GDP-L-fucose synthase
MTILVTGGTGFLGSRLKHHRPSWFYTSSKQLDLLDYREVKHALVFLKPKVIIHLAGRVGGIKANAENPVQFLEENIQMNHNLLKAANETNTPRVLSSLSTCAFPDVVKEYPFAEEDMMSGPPAETNYTYGCAKRLLHIHSMAYNKQHGRQYTTFSPSNIYGIGDHFDDDSSHFISALIGKISKAKNGDKIELWGTGTPLRQPLYVDDLCRIIPILMGKHLSDIPLLVTPNENLTIKEMAEIGAKAVGKDIKFVFNGKLDGQHRKDGSNKKLIKLIGNPDFTSFEEGFKTTYEWYENNIKQQ